MGFPASSFLYLITEGILLMQGFLRCSSLAVHGQVTQISSLASQRILYDMCALALYSQYLEFACYGVIGQHSLVNKFEY